MNTEDTAKKSKGYRRIIPSMTALLVFEAVARLNSFTQAARELGVTQAAVSKQVKMLEENLGTQLFHRLHRDIRLTGEGSALFAVVSKSMQQIARVFDTISEGSAEQELVLVTTAAFSQLRVMPRLAALRAALPNVQLRLATQMFTGDLRNHDIDLAVRYGNGKWEDGHSMLLFHEEIFPVCSPAWLASHPEPSSLEDLFQADLIDSDVTTEGWMNWQSWFKEQAQSPPRLHYSLRCNLYSDTIQAALHGHGVALGWGRLLDHLLASGELVRLTPFVVKPKDAYYVVLPAGRAATPTLLRLVEWLRDERSDTRP
ncbi:LysR substrate-binding domain-containing protein [Pseudomonas sp. R5(2019)]|uniref:LysR substrate-binding domain-containing protein n=1 Tax=Pseudomonas sp. R5(2019) TaxID=2697566 RepID=UPI001411C235|nr:LysR substrate-binding domain-containing protein [Pseudomonas sp. R5(2019)]NBA98466.1 LysR family transcriptional regulator [Pseudomonas sp. R5(2019)]